MTTGAEATATTHQRVERLLSSCAVLFAVVIASDVLTAGWMTTRSSRGMDYVVLAAALAFLGCWLVNRAVARKLALTLLAVVFTIGLFELVLMAISPSDRSEFPNYVWQPGMECVVRPVGLAGVSKKGDVKINSRGIRGPEFSDDDDYRVLCVGGSTTECLYLDDDKSWPALLAERIEQPSRHVWVGNVGRSGLMAVDHATLLEHLPEAQQVDCWLVLCGINDFGQQLNGRYQHSAAHSWERTFLYRSPGITWPLLRPLHRNLLTFRMMEGLRKRVDAAIRLKDVTAFQDFEADWMEERRSQRAQGQQSDELPPLDDYLAEYERQLTRIIALASESRKRVIFATQPTLLQPNMPANLEKLTLGGRLPDGRYLSNAQRHRGMQRYNQRLKEVCRREGVDCVELAERLPKTTDTFYDDCHFNEAGAERVASLLADRFSAADSRGLTTSNARNTIHKPLKVGKSVARPPDRVGRRNY